MPRRAGVGAARAKRLGRRRSVLIGRGGRRLAPQNSRCGGDEAGKPAAAAEKRSRKAAPVAPPIRARNESAPTARARRACPARRANPGHRRGNRFRGGRLWSNAQPHPRSGGSASQDANVPGLLRVLRYRSAGFFIQDESIVTSSAPPLRPVTTPWTIRPGGSPGVWTGVKSSARPRPPRSVRMRRRRPTCACK